MDLVKTKRQLVEVNIPTKLEIGTELQKRGVLSEDFAQVKRGDEGESWVFERLIEFGNPNWSIAKNFWLETHGVFESDALILTEIGLHHLEIKNYNGRLDFKNGNCLINGNKIGYNPIYQAQRATNNLENLVREKFPGVPVQGVLLLVGEHNTVGALEQIGDIQVIMRNEVRNFIWQLVNNERNHQGRSIDKEAILKWLESFETANPFKPAPLDLETSKQLRKGICCSQCGSFDLDTGKTYIRCACGMNEPRENAIVRTICEYGVLHFDKNLTTSGLLDFFGGEISRTNLTKYLNKHFTKVGSGKGTIFINNLVKPANIYDEFGLERYRFQEMK